MHTVLCSTDLISIQIQGQEGAERLTKIGHLNSLRAGGQAGRHGSADPAVAHPGLTSSTLPPGVPDRAHALRMAALMADLLRQGPISRAMFSRPDFPALTTRFWKWKR